MELKKYWIRGHKDRSPEVIKNLEDLGGVVPQGTTLNIDGSDEQSIYYISPYKNWIHLANIRTSHAAAIMWAGEELKLPEQKPVPKFKIDDEVKFKDNVAHPVHVNKGKVVQITRYRDYAECTDKFPYQYDTDSLQEYAEENLEIVVKPEPKFKVGDKVKFYENTYKIEEINLDGSGKYLYLMDNGFVNIYEDGLKPANTLKEFDPVMVSNGVPGKWGLRLFYSGRLCYDHIDIKGTVLPYIEYKYIVPLSDFDFNDLESNIKKSVV